jgi:hypothetical protein
MIDFAALISRGYESKELDYKSAIYWCENEKKGCCEIVKDILAIANHGGGWIIIGVSEIDSGFSPDGVSGEQASTFDTTRVNRFLNNYADPPINTTIHKPKFEDKLFVCIAIPGFSDTPHICQKEYPDVLTAPTLYVRTYNNESAPIKTSADFRDIVERGIKNRSDHLLESFRTILHGGLLQTKPTAKESFLEQIETAKEIGNTLNPHLTKNYAYRESAFFPSQFNEDYFEIPVLSRMAQNAMDHFRGWPFIFYSSNRGEITHVVNNGYETIHVEKHPFTGGDVFHFWKLYQSGLLYTKEILWEDTLVSATGKEMYVDYINLSLMCAQAIWCLTKLYETVVDESEEITLILSLIGIKDRMLKTENKWVIYSDSYGFTCHADSLTYQKSLPLVDWRAGLIDHALDMCKYFLQRFNWDNPNLDTSKKFIEKMLQKIL